MMTKEATSTTDPYPLSYQKGTGLTTSTMNRRLGNVTFGNEQARSTKQEKIKLCDLRKRQLLQNKQQRISFQECHGEGSYLLKANARNRKISEMNGHL